MSQFILLFSTGGPGDYDDHIEVECTGRKLTLQQAQDRNLVTQDQLRRHRNGPYDKAWYEVKPGDEIVFTIDEWVWEGDEPRYPRYQKLTYVVPPDGLSNPPIDLDDIFFRRLGDLREYYGENAAQKQ
jgi:hypothetical protein